MYVMPPDIAAYHEALAPEDRAICDQLFTQISAAMPEAECKVWHRHPVWFLEGNPIVGYHKLKNAVRLLFWSGQSFETAGLSPEGKFKAAEVRYSTTADIDSENLAAWLAESKHIQWDYKNIVKRKGVLERLK